MIGPSRDTTVLEAADLVKQYGRLKALDGVSLSVRSGELVVLLGPNGAGKTTLFQLLAALFVPDGGALRIAGHDMRRNPIGGLAAMGIVFQQPTLDLDLSAEANLRFHARLHGLAGADARRRIADELARFGLTDQAHLPARQLSGGNRRRVELARALLHSPELLLLDEPTVGLDPAARQDLLAHVRRLVSDEGLAVLWATHLVDEASRADRVLVLHRGRIVAVDSPQTLADGAGSIEAAYFSLTGAAAPAGSAAGL